MINEFHTCLTYRKATGSTVIGQDYQEAGLEFPPLSESAARIWRCLLVQPDRAESINWRAAEIRQALQRSDLVSLLTKFDGRTGYLPAELLAEMVDLFRPHVYGAPSPATIRVNGKYASNAYRLDTWSITVTATEWSIMSKGYPSLSGDINGNKYIVAPLPGHSDTILVPVELPGEYWVSWAARPTVSFAQTAAELRSTTKPAIVNLAQDTKNRFDVAERTLLMQIATGDGEDVAQVCAAALLFAGYTANHVRRQNRDSSTP